MPSLKISQLPAEVWILFWLVVIASGIVIVLAVTGYFKSPVDFLGPDAPQNPQEFNSVALVQMQYVDPPPAAGVKDERPVWYQMILTKRTETSPGVFTLGSPYWIVWDPSKKTVAEEFKFDSGETKKAFDFLLGEYSNNPINKAYKKVNDIPLDPLDDSFASTKKYIRVLDQNGITKEGTLSK